jgi:hypothetical protein
LLRRCHEAALVWDPRDPITRMDPRHEATVRRALEQLVASGQVRRIQTCSYVVYIAW